MASETEVVEMGGRPDENPVTRIIQKFTNKSFIFSLMGALEGGVVVLGLLVICLLGSAISHDEPSKDSWTIMGHSYYTFLFIVGFWCFMTSTILLFTSATSVDTANFLPKTTFFIAYHIIAAAFYLFGTMALLVESGKYDDIFVGVGNQHQNYSDVKGLVLGGGSFGVMVTVLYITICIFAIRKYRQDRI